MHYYQFNIGDYIRETAHLSIEEDCAYRRLMDFYYDTENPIPNKTKWVSRRLRMGADDQIIKSILDEFFELQDDDRWHHARCDKEIAAYQAKAETARVNGSKGGRPKKPKKTQQVNSRNPEKSESKANHKPLTINQEPSLSAKNTFSTDDYFSAVYIHNKIKKLNQNSKDPNLDKWANEIRLMRERDKRSHEEIMNIFNWANNDPFWRTNILSPSKLRKQFDQLTIKSNGEKNGTHQQNSKPSLAERLEANRKRAEQQSNEQPMGENGLHIRT